MSFQYHELSPTNDNSDGFSEFDSIDFEMQAVGRKLVKNSVMFECEIKEIKKDGTNALVVADKVGLDHRIGFHGLHESWTSSSAKFGMVENLQSYGRYCASINSASLDENDYCSAFHQAEGKNPTADAGRYVVQPSVMKADNATGTVHSKKPQVCIMPKICFNSMVGDDYSFDKNGSIRLSTVLARANNFLFGASVAGATYKIDKVKLKFKSLPDDGKQGKILMNSAVSVKAAINSNSANLSFKVPAKACSGVVVNFIQQSRENSDTHNSYALENLPNLNQIQMLFNSNTSQGVSYEILDKGEMQAGAVAALGDAGHSQVSASKVSVNEGFLIGQNFEEFVDLSAQPFSLNIKHEAPAISTKPRIAYLYFMNLITLL